MQGRIVDTPSFAVTCANGIRQISIRGRAPFFYQYVQPSLLHHQCREQLRTPQAQAWSGRNIDPPDQISSVFEKRYFKWETATLEVILTTGKKRDDWLLLGAESKIEN